MFGKTCHPDNSAPALLLTVVHCRGVKGFELTGETDPYVVLKYGKKTFKTRVIDDAGADADFHEVFSCSQAPESTLPLEVQVFDKDTFRSELMGAGRLELEELTTKGHCLVDCELKNSRGQFNGIVRLAMRYYSSRDHLSCLAG